MSSQTQKSRPGVRQVAELANVSIATISRVINNSQCVRPQTRLRVLEAMAELNYHVPRYAARRSGRVAVLVADAGAVGYQPGSEALMDVVKQRLGESGYELVTVPLASPRSTEHAPEAVVDNEVCGILALGMDPPPFLTGPTSFVPSVTIGITATHGDTSAAVSDNARGAATAIRELLRIGHRRVLLLRPGCGLDDLGAQMQNAYDHEHRALGVPIDDRLICECPCSVAWAAEKVHLLLSRGVSFTAIYGHYRAIVGARQALARSGIAVPRQVSLIAHWDAPYLADLHPAVDAIAVNTRELVASGLELLEGRMIGRYRDPVRAVLPMKHVTRDTVAEPPAAKV